MNNINNEVLCGTLSHDVSQHAHYNVMKNTALDWGVGVMSLENSHNILLFFGQWDTQMLHTQNYKQYCNTVADVAATKRYAHIFDKKDTYKYNMDNIYITIHFIADTLLLL